jgi:putative FmdB family regulatory protein
MPNYTYKCPVCGKKKDMLLLSIPKKEKPPICNCGETMERVIGKDFHFILKGSGFYSTDYQQAEKEIEKLKDEK